MMSTPKLDDRKKQHYVGIRTQVIIGKIRKLILVLLAEVLAWLRAKGVSPAGPPFIRFHVINMEADMDIELGWPVATAMRGDARVSVGVIPKGR